MYVCKFRSTRTRFQFKKTLPGEHSPENFCCVGPHFQACMNLADVFCLRCFSEARKKHFRRNFRKCSRMRANVCSEHRKMSLFGVNSVSAWKKNKAFSWTVWIQNSMITRMSGPIEQTERQQHSRVKDTERKTESLSLPLSSSLSPSSYHRFVSWAKFNGGPSRTSKCRKRRAATMRLVTQLRLK